MKSKRAFYIVSAILIVSLSVTAALCAGHSVRKPIGEAKVISREVDIEQYLEITERIGFINLELQSSGKQKANELVTEYEALERRLEKIGAIPSADTLRKLPASSNTRLYPGNIADLVAAYGDMFLFTGWYETVNYNNTIYDTFFLAVTEKPGTNYMSTSNMFNNVNSGCSVPSVFQIVYDVGYSYFSNEMINNPLISYTIGQLFPALVALVNNSMVQIANESVYEHLYVLTTSEFYFSYVYDSATQMWLPCYTSGRTFISETHFLYFSEWIGNMYTLNHDNFKEQTYAKLGDRAILDMASYAVVTFAAWGYQAPMSLENGQVGTLKWFGESWLPFLPPPVKAQIYPRTCTYPADIPYVAY